MSVLFLQLRTHRVVVACQTGKKVKEFIKNQDLQDGDENKKTDLLQPHKWSEENINHGLAQCLKT